jgi:hypothetical protein
MYKTPGDLNKALLLFCLSLFVMFFVAGSVYGQEDSLKVAPMPQTIQQNAGFDVIVKVNGDIVYGLVKEVGPEYIRYQRTDIPDGPVYIIPRNEVYVISYRNQVKDYIGHLGSNIDSIGHPAQVTVVDSMKPPLIIPVRRFSFRDKNLFRNATVSAALGFLRSFTKVKDAKNYSTPITFPAILFGYEVNYKSNLLLGVQAGFGTRNFSNQQYSSYDSTQNNVTLKENIFGLYVYGRYYLSTTSSKWQPYILGGIGITSSNIISNNTISFTNGNSQVILVKSGMRSTELGVTARIGTTYSINDQLKLSLDAGVGLSVINIGVLVKIK